MTVLVCTRGNDIVDNRTIVLDRYPRLHAGDFRHALPSELAPLDTLPCIAVVHLDAALNTEALRARRAAWSSLGYLMRLAEDRDRLAPADRRRASLAEDLPVFVRRAVEQRTEDAFDPAAALRWCAGQMLVVYYELAVTPGRAELSVATGRPALHRRHRLDDRMADALHRLARRDTTWSRCGGDAGTAEDPSAWLPDLTHPARRTARIAWTGWLTAALAESPFALTA
ncbi:MAG TPA: hypothetical protein VGL02_26625 [Streptomyces sp.]